MLDVLRFGQRVSLKAQKSLRRNSQDVSDPPASGFPPLRCPSQAMTGKDPWWLAWVGLTDSLIDFGRRLQDFKRLLESFHWALGGVADFLEALGCLPHIGRGAADPEAKCSSELHELFYFNKGKGTLT